MTIFSSFSRNNRSPAGIDLLYHQKRAFKRENWALISALLLFILAHDPLSFTIGIKGFEQVLGLTKDLYEETSSKDYIVYMTSLIICLFFAKNRPKSSRLISIIATVNLVITMLGLYLQKSFLSLTIWMVSKISLNLVKIYIPVKIREGFEKRYKNLSTGLSLILLQLLNYCIYPKIQNYLKKHLIEENQEISPKFYIFAALSLILCIAGSLLLHIYESQQDIKYWPGDLRKEAALTFLTEKEQQSLEQGLLRDYYGLQAVSNNQKDYYDDVGMYGAAGRWRKRLKRFRANPDFGAKNSSKEAKNSEQRTDENRQLVDGYRTSSNTRTITRIDSEFSEGVGREDEAGLGQLVMVRTQSSPAMQNQRNNLLLNSESGKGSSRKKSVSRKDGGNLEKIVDEGDHEEAYTPRKKAVGLGEGGQEGLEGLQGSGNARAVKTTKLTKRVKGGVQSGQKGYIGARGTQLAHQGSGNLPGKVGKMGGKIQSLKVRKNSNFRSDRNYDFELKSDLDEEDAARFEGPGYALQQPNRGFQDLEGRRLTSAFTQELEDDYRQVDQILAIRAERKNRRLLIPLFAYLLFSIFLAERFINFVFLEPKIPSEEVVAQSYEWIRLTVLPAISSVLIAFSFFVFDPPSVLFLQFLAFFVLVGIVSVLLGVNGVSIGYDEHPFLYPVLRISEQIFVSFPVTFLLILDAYSDDFVYFMYGMVIWGSQFGLYDSFLRLFLLRVDIIVVVPCLILVSLNYLLASVATLCIVRDRALV